MKILVFSDTHKSLGRAYEIIRKHKNIDTIFHLGDNTEDARDIAEKTGKKVIYVAGNCDSPIEGEEYSKIYESEEGRILLTHGHKEGVNYDLTKLKLKAESEDCKMALFGHTHIAGVEESDGIIFINPGSLTKPRDGSNGSYAIVTVDKNGIDGTIMYYKDPNKKPAGGYIRDLLNNSDRF